MLLYDTAARLFARKGYRGSSIRDLALALDLQKSSLYQYFDSKEDLLFSVLDESVTVALHEIESICSSHIPPLEKLRKCIQYYTSCYAGDRDWLILLVNELDNLDLVRQQTNTERKTLCSISQGNFR